MNSSETNVLEKYGIKKEYKIIRDQYFEVFYYAVTYTSYNSGINFLNFQNSDVRYHYFNGMALSDFNYDSFQSKNIMTTIIKDELIPIGLVECLGLDNERFNKCRFTIAIKKRDLYRAPQILKNFEKAIEIKAQALDFIENFK